MAASAHRPDGSAVRIPVRGSAPAAPGDRPHRYYVGRRAADGRTGVWAVGAGAERLTHPGRWSGAPFTWGPVAPGAEELAAALLADHAGVRVPRTVAAWFAGDVLAALEPDGFILTGDDLRLWLDMADGREPGAAPEDPDGGGSGRI